MHVQKTGKRFWARIAQIFVILGFLCTISILNQSWTVYKWLYQIGFEKDKYANYTLEMEKNDTLIHLRGGLGFGVSKEVGHLLKEHPNVKGIILDSNGGRIYEGRELSKLISFYGLDTYSLQGCYSSCTTAFISGKNRFLGVGANLGFHQYGTGDKDLDYFFDLKTTEEEDLHIFQRQGVKAEFIEKLFNTPSNDFWCPTADEMLNAGVIHGIVNQSDILPIKYSGIPSDTNESFEDEPTFRAIQKYEPETYQKIKTVMIEQLKKGASGFEAGHIAADYMEEMGIRCMARTSNDALINYAQVIVDVLKKIEERDPILCLKIIYPQQYGPLNFSMYFPGDKPMKDVMEKIIVDAYEKNNPQVDVNAAELTIEKLRERLREYSEYLDPQKLQNRKEYKLHCDAIIKLYELILLEDANTAGNVFRYLYSQDTNGL